MSRHEPFLFFDGLSDSAKGKLPEGLRVSGENDPELLLLIRLLSGNLGIKLSDKKIPQRINYFSPDLKNFGHMWAKKIPSIGWGGPHDRRHKHIHKPKEIYKQILLPRDTLRMLKFFCS